MKANDLAMKTMEFRVKLDEFSAGVELAILSGAKEEGRTRSGDQLSDIERMIKGHPELDEAHAACLAEYESISKWFQEALIAAWEAGNLEGKRGLALRALREAVQAPDPEKGGKE